jgi:hypothetical protein
MLLPGFGATAHAAHEQITHFACIEVAVRGTEPGRVRVGKAARR